MSFPGQSNNSMNLKDAVLKARRALQTRLSNLLGLSATERALSAPVVADPDRHGIALVAIVKDEARYIGEWIAFHTNLGVRSIYIYDNGSTDETVALAQGRRFLADVRVIPWMNFGRHIRIQTAAYNHAVANFGRRYRWMMFLDIDEFVFPKQGGDLNETMAAYDSVPAVSFPWQMFGPSGHKRRPDTLVVEAYRERAAFPFTPETASLLNYKTIADPTAINGHIPTIASCGMMMAPCSMMQGRVSGASIDSISNMRRPSASSLTIISRAPMRSSSKRSPNAGSRRKDGRTTVKGSSISWGASIAIRSGMMARSASQAM